MPSADLVAVLERLLVDTNHAYFEVRRGWLNLANGTEQSTTLVLAPDELTDATGEIDPRLLAASRVSLYLTWPDSGFAVIDLTSREYVAFGASETMKAALDRLKSDLKASDGHRRTSQNHMLWCLLGPLLAIVGLAGLASAAPPPVGSAHLNDETLDIPEDLPGWMQDTYDVILNVWILLALIATWIAVQRKLGGAMRIWPRMLNRATFATLVHNEPPRSFRRPGLVAQPVGVSSFLAA